MNGPGVAVSPSRPADAFRRVDAIRLVLIALAYAFTVKLALFIPDAENVLAAIWPPGGVALGALLLSPRRQRRAILATIFVTGTVVNLLSGRPTLASLGFMVANVLESWGSAWLFEWWSKGRRVTFTRLSDVFALAASALGVNAVTALVGAAAALLAVHAPWRDLYLSWWIADAMGIMLVTPLVVVCAQPWRWPSRPWLNQLEPVAVGCALGAFTWLGFLGTLAKLALVPRPYWICVPLMWAGLRLGTRVTVLLLALVALIAVGLTLTSQGVHPLGGDNAEQRLEMVQVFLGVMILTGLALAASVAERKEAEMALQTSEERYVLVERAVNGALWERNLVTGELYCSPRWQNLLGYERAETPRRLTELMALIHPEDQARLREALRSHLEDRQPFSLEYRIRHKAGNYRWLLTRGEVIRDADGRPVRLLGAVTDVTERKRAEEELRASEESYRNQFAANVAVMLLVDPRDGAIVDANAAASGFYGYPLARLRGMRITDINRLPEAEVRRAMGSVRQENGARFEFPHRLADGSVRTVEVSSSWIQSGERRLLHSIVFDITERKRAEAAAAQAREHYQDLLETASDGIHLLDQEGNLVEASSSFYRMLGYAPEEAPRLNVADWDAQWSPEELKARIVAVAKQPATFETRHRCRDGRIIEVEINARQIEIAGRTHLYASSRDITERKRTEERVRQLAREQQIILENANIGISLVRERRQVWVNDKAAEIFRYPRGELDGHSTRKLYPTQEAYDRFGRDAYPALAKGASFESVQLLVRGDGVQVWVRYNGKAIDPTDMTKGTLWLLEDITARKLAEEESEENQRRLALAMDQAHLAYWEMDAATRTFTFNDRFYSLYGTTAQREGGYQMPAEVYAREFLPVGDQPVFADDIARLVSGEFDEMEQEHRIRRRDGELRDLRLRITVVRDANGRVVGTRGSNQDVTESKRAQEALRSASIYARNLIEVNLDPLVTISADGKITDVNEAFVQATGVPRERLIGADFSDYFTEPARARAGYQQVFAEGLVRDYPLAIRHVSGRVTEVVYNASIYRDQHGRVLGMVASARDVTERIGQQRKVEALLAQTAQDALTKSSLLSEVNHRVTNNLTSVLGLMVYEVNGLSGDDRTRIAPALDRLQQRIRGLLTVHRMLSQSTWAPVNLAQLADEIIRAALHAAPCRSQVMVNIEPSALRVSPRQANGIALIFNELATNTVKHAHQESRPTRIRVELVATAGVVTICYRDNGPGFPTDVLSTGRSNVGLKLIRDLVATTLAGTVELENDGGAKATIRLQPEKETRT